MAKSKLRVKVILECTVCGSRNYITEKNRNNTPGRLTLKKYCPQCGKHTLHKETK